MRDFIGVKIALIHNDELLVIQRDDIPGLRYAGMWDFAGGGNEPGETPFDCIKRELYEELGLELIQDAIIWQKVYPAMDNPAHDAYFMVAPITKNDIGSIVFGDEGQGWKMMPIAEFMAHPNAIDALKLRIRDYLDTLN